VHFSAAATKKSPEVENNIPTLDSRNRAMYIQACKRQQQPIVA